MRAPQTLGVLLAVLAVYTPPSNATGFTAYIHERMLDKVAAQSELPTWGGTYGIPNTPLSFSWSTKIEDVAFDVNGDGIGFTANVVTRVPWLEDTLTFAQSIDGRAYMYFAEADGEIRFRVNQVDVPVQVTIPFWGTFTVYTHTQALPIRMNYPLTPEFRVSAGGAVVTVRAYDLSREYLQGRIKVTGKTRMW